MNQPWTHKIIATIFTMVVLFPMMVQVSHALEKHEHTICIAKYEKHFHQDEDDCVICKLHLNNQVFYFTNAIVFQNVSIVLEQPYNIYTLKYNSLTQFKPSRAPPTLV